MSFFHRKCQAEINRLKEQLKELPFQRLDHLDGAGWAALDQNDLREAMTWALSRNSRLKFRDTMIERSDREYVGYDEDTIDAVWKMLPGNYDHKEYLAGKIAKPYEGSDCDNDAEWKSAWLHRALPAAAVCSISAYKTYADGTTHSAHAFLGIVTDLRAVIWKMGDIQKYDAVYRMRF